MGLLFLIFFSFCGLDCNNWDLEFSEDLGKCRLVGALLVLLLRVQEKRKKRGGDHGWRRSGGATAETRRVTATSSQRSASRSFFLHY